MPSHRVVALLFTLTLALQGSCAGEDPPVPPDAGAQVDDAGTDDTDAGVAPAFGDPCLLADDACGDGLLCISPGATVGFCSKNCATLGTACPDAPQGTAAYCIVGGEGTPNGEPGCAFLCAAQGQTFSCPGETVCEAADDPPGSGQRLCLP